MPTPEPAKTPSLCPRQQVVKTFMARTPRSSRAPTLSRAWAGGDAQIRNTAAKARGAKLGVEAKPFLRSHPGYAVWLDKEVSDALSKANPLVREMGMDGARWKLVEELALADAYGLPAVLAFAVKLMLVTRWSGMKEEAGREQLEKLVSQLEENAAQSGASGFK